MSSQSSASLQKVRNKRDLSVFDVTTVDSLTAEDTNCILELAAYFQKHPQEAFDVLRGKTVITCFYENSTRTRSSFELAAKQLGATTVGITAASSSTKKGESVLDTALTLSALQASILIVRSAEAGTADFLAKHIPVSIVNAGDGWHEHPSQGLLDLKTMRDHHGTLKRKTITIVGDILHSRVFGSLVRLCKKEEMNIQLCCPETLLPKDYEQFGATYISTLKNALPKSDVVYALRVQEERGARGYVPNLGEYAKHYCITPERFDLAKKTAILMHAGPVIRDTDISSLLMDHERCHVLKQVENGLAVRKALLWLLADRSDQKKKPL